MSVSRKFFWDFFGPTAAGTAAHFERHLKQFLDVQAIAAVTTSGTIEEGPLHSYAWCEATTFAAQEIVAQALKPRRSSAPSPDSETHPPT